MNHVSLPDLEERVIRNGNGGEFQFRPFAIPIPHEPLTLKGLLTTPVNRSGYYYDRVYPKERIVLHYTAGHIRSDLQTLTRQDYHVSVPFVIARSGTIFQLFSSKFWSGHIGQGIGNTGNGNAQDKVTIGIELSNYGYLTPKNGNLETCYSRVKDKTGKVGPEDIYCSQQEVSAYIKLTTPYRLQSYYAAYTDAQYESLILLLRYLTTQYAIPRAFLPEPLRYEDTDQVLVFKGIVSHVNYRKEGKWDIGQAFDWTKVIHGVQTDSFQPTITAATTRGAPAATGLHSEEAMEALLPKPKDPAREDEPYEE